MHPDPEIADAWPFWRVVLEGYDTISGADRLSIDDIEQMCLAADAWHAARPEE